MKTSNLIIVILALVLLLVGGGVYYNSRINKLNKQLTESQSVVRVVSDSLHTVATVYGELIYGYAMLSNIKDSLKNVSFYKDKKIYTEQTAIASLRMQLAHHADTLYAASDTMLSHIFYNTYKDSGLVVNLTDSVSFRKLKNLIWLANNDPSFFISLSLRNTIGRNKDGTFYGSVETFSHLLKIDNIKTIVDDQYIPAVVKHTPSEFAIGGSLDNNTAAIGLRLGFGNWQLGGEYILISNQTLTGTLTRIRGSLYYFLF